MIDQQQLLHLCGQYSVPLTADQAQQLDRYASLLVEWNQRMNLTAITDPQQIAVKHFLDSLLLLEAVQLPQGSSLIDVGTGAGFPSLPVKIARPDLRLTLLDSLRKRIGFLQEVSGQLGLGCACVHARAEDAGKDKAYREGFDFSCARAVANLRELAEYCLPFVRVGGAFVALKGYDVEEELREAKNAVSTMGGKVEEVKKFTLPDEGGRSIVVIRKISQTPPQFPRNAAKMTKKPIR